MSEFVLNKGVKVMKSSDEGRPLEILRAAYNGMEGHATVSRNFYLRLEQDEMLKELARYNGETKVTILRAIIDEWRQIKLQGQA